MSYFLLTKNSGLKNIKIIIENNLRIINSTFSFIPFLLNMLKRISLLKALIEKYKIFDKFIADSPQHHLKNLLNKANLA